MSGLEDGERIQAETKKRKEAIGENRFGSVYSLGQLGDEEVRRREDRSLLFSGTKMKAGGLVMPRPVWVQAATSTL